MGCAIFRMNFVTFEYFFSFDRNVIHLKIERTHHVSSKSENSITLKKLDDFQYLIK